MRRTLVIGTARRRVYDITEEEFRSAVSNSLSLRGTIRTLDLHDHTNTYKRLRQRISDLGLDVSHFRAHGRRPRRYHRAQLEAAVAGSRSIRQTLEKLGLRPEGGYSIIRRDLRAFQIDTSHFRGRGWRLGETRPVSPPRPLSQLLVQDSPTSTCQIRKRLLREGLLELRCQICATTEWLGRPLTLELDHVNGINNDHRLENLRLLCPNCHSQTDTFRGRNRGRYSTAQPTQLSIL